MDSKGVYVAGIFLEFFHKPVYSTMVVEKFQIYAVKITGKYICESKNWMFIFTHALKQNSPLGFHQKLPILPEQRFGFCFVVP